MNRAHNDPLHNLTMSHELFKETTGLGFTMHKTELNQKPVKMQDSLIVGQLD